MFGDFSIFLTYKNTRSRAKPCFCHPQRSDPHHPRESVRFVILVDASLLNFPQVNLFSSSSNSCSFLISRSCSYFFISLRVVFRLLAARGPPAPPPGAPRAVQAAPRRPPALPSSPLLLFYFLPCSFCRHPFFCSFPPSSMAEHSNRRWPKPKPFESPGCCAPRLAHSVCR